ARGNRLTVNANGATTRYTYDLANRLLTETNPLTRVTTYTYDAAGNRQTKLDANGRTTTYVYDENRRLLETRFFDGTQYTFAYDTRGNRTLERSPSHERALSYDELGRVSSVNDVTLGRTLQYAYDASGNRTRLQNGSLVYTYAYDGEGRLSAANGPGGSVQLSYDALSRRRVLSRSNGVNTHYSYDAVGQVQDVVHERGQAVLARFAYTYSDGNRTSKTNASGDVEAYGYDSDRRLIQVNYGTDRVVSYSLSGIGNRSSMDDVRTVAGQTYSTSYTYNGFNQLLSSNASCTGTGCPARVVTGFAYDNNGNLLTETVGTTTVRGYTWDADNRLRSLTTPGGLHQYQYDANGLRTQQVTPTGVTKYVLDGASVLEELDAGNQQKAHYLTNPQGIDDIFAFTQGSSTYFPLMDALGSVYAVSNSSGQVTRSYGYDVYGERTNVSGASPELAFGFTGREHDASGLNYNRDRYLDVRVGRWHQPDRAQDGASYYEYARGMPSLAIDPSGQFSTGAPITLGRAAVRAVPAFDSWTSTALNHPLLFLALIASLGIVSDDVVREANQLCPEDRDGIIEFHRGEEEARAVEVARTQSFRSVGFGLGESHEFGAALYLSRDYEVGVRYAKRAAARVGRGALIWVTISNAIWQIVRKHPGVRDGIGIAGETGEQTVVPLGPPLDLFDFSSGKMILERYGRYSR
ncbi:MAG: RHS repeat domain-containing protein, partial [Myxococcaceae bacterium]